MEESYSLRSRLKEGGRWVYTNTFGPLAPGKCLQELAFFLKGGGNFSIDVRA